MKTIKAHLLESKLTLTGLALITISFVIFLFTMQAGAGAGEGVFLINFALAAGYLLAVFFSNLRRNGGGFYGRITHTLLLLLLWFISAFALNREMNVFDSSVPWLCVWLLLSCISLLLIVVLPQLPLKLAYVVYFFLGAAFLLFSYYAVYLLPLYVFSAAAAIALGLSLHTFIPLGLAIVTFILILRGVRQNRTLLFSALAGFGFPLLVCAAFLVIWSITNRKIDYILNKNALNEDKLPGWVAVSQHISPSPWAERLLKAGLIYREANPDGDLFWGRMPSHNFDEPLQHDPLVVLATLFLAKPDLGEDDRIRILKSLYNARHQAQERLWAGDELETSNIISNIKLFPEYRMAYTEKMLTIKNNAGRTWSQQEGIYTFHLPEGSVVSALSLWIDGKEEKSRLTTQAKADSAYKQVVGVEMHDPSVVHWQEGNTVSVRIFPCTPQENRRFKIGITSPLRKEGDQLIYDNPGFEGPRAGHAPETVQLSFSKTPAGLQLPAGFTPSGAGVYHADRSYEPNWQLSIPAAPLVHSAFSFADTAYAVKEYQPLMEPYQPGAIYLDINKAWSRKELMQVWNTVKALPVYVYDGQLVRLTDANLNEVYSRLCTQNFSLFPVFEIARPEQALLISKSGDTAPNLNDLEGSEFAGNLTHYLRTPRHIRFYNLGSQLTPYLKALKELRVFTYAEGNAEALTRLLTARQFLKDQEDENTVVLNSAGIMICKTPGLPAQPAPDHLLRLFVYNDVMKKAAPGYFMHGDAQPALVKEAGQAYIVSPVSSMIVLETPKDYERFGIEENKNSLKNASMKSSGAVPEPQEWMLIAMVLLVAGYLMYKRKAYHYEL